MESRETQAARAHTGMRSLGAKKTSSFVYPELEGGTTELWASSGGCTKTTDLRVPGGLTPARDPGSPAGLRQHKLPLFAVL